MYLSSWLNSSHHAQEHDNPSNKQYKDKMPDKPATLINGWSRIKSFPVPVILCPTSLLTLLKKGTVIQSGATGIGQRVLEWGKQVVKAPSNDHVVVHPHKQTHNNAGIADTSKVGVNGIPYSHRSLSQTLANCELKEKQRDAQKKQTEEVWNQKCTCKWKKFLSPAAWFYRNTRDTDMPENVLSWDLLYCLTVLVKQLQSYSLSD